MALLYKRSLSILIIITSFLSARPGNAQTIDTVSTFSITGYIDAYYAYYTDSVGPGNFQKAVTVSPRSNSPSLNTAQISMQYNADKVRAMATIHYGDIATIISSPSPYTPLLEAHVGFKVYSKLWIDAGLFRTHFGTEYLLPVENLVSSLAIGTNYEPVYESGIRLNFDPSTKLEINMFLLNGYGLFVDNNNKKSFGMGVTYAVNDKVGIGYTNYIGDDSPPADTTTHLRIAQNVFINYQYKKIKIQVGGDYIIQQNADAATGTKMASMYSGLATIKYQWATKFSVYGRGEVFNDPDGFMAGVITDYTGTRTGYKIWGVTAGMEYKPTEKSFVRLEGRRLQMDKNEYIFDYNGYENNYRYEVMVDAGITFDLLKRDKIVNSE